MTKAIDKLTKEQIKRFFVGFLITAIMHLVSKIVTAVIASDHVDTALDGVMNSSSQIVAWFVSSISSGIFATKYVGEKET